MIRIDLESAAV